MTQASTRISRLACVNFGPCLVAKTYHSTVALQEGFFKHLGDMVTVLLNLVCLILFYFFM